LTSTTDHYTLSLHDALPIYLNDVKYDAFLANYRTLADPEVVKVEPGGQVLLRIINSSSMSAYHIDLGQLDGELTAVDGFAVTPVDRKSTRLNSSHRTISYAV